MHTVHHKKHLLTRVRRIAGQTQALEKALESGSDCNDILQPVSYTHLSSSDRKHSTEERLKKTGGRDFP